MLGVGQVAYSFYEKEWGYLWSVVEDITTPSLSHMNLGGLSAVAVH